MMVCAGGEKPRSKEDCQFLRNVCVDTDIRIEVFIMNIQYFLTQDQLKVQKEPYL